MSRFLRDNTEVLFSIATVLAVLSPFIIGALLSPSATKETLPFEFNRGEVVIDFHDNVGVILKCGGDACLVWTSEGEERWWPKVVIKTNKEGQKK